MATRATIAKIQKDGSGIKAIYLHSDGYLEHAGRILDEHYRDESKVDELIALGDLSAIDKNIGNKIEFGNYKLRAKNDDHSDDHFNDHFQDHYNDNYFNDHLMIIKMIIKMIIILMIIK